MARIFVMVAEVLYSGETVCGVSLLVSMTGLTGCVDGELLPTANSGFRISLPSSTTGLGGRVQFIIATANLVTLAPMHKYFLCARVQCAINSQCGYRVACSKGDDYLCYYMRRYLTGSFLIAYIAVRYSPLYYGLLAISILLLPLSLLPLSLLHIDHPTHLYNSHTQSKQLIYIVY